MPKPIYARPDDLTAQLFEKAHQLTKVEIKSKNKLALKYIREGSERTLKHFKKNPQLVTD